MALLFLEALGALALLVFIVWWTMFSGRKHGELPDDTLPEASPDGSKKAGGESAGAASGDKGRSDNDNDPKA